MASCTGRGPVVVVLWIVLCFSKNFPVIARDDEASMGYHVQRTFTLQECERGESSRLCVVAEDFAWQS